MLFDTDMEIAIPGYVTRRSIVMAYVRAALSTPLWRKGYPIRFTRSYPATDNPEVTPKDTVEITISRKGFSTVEARMGVAVARLSDPLGLRHALEFTQTYEIRGWRCGEGEIEALTDHLIGQMIRMGMGLSVTLEDAVALYRRSRVSGRLLDRTGEETKGHPNFLDLVGADYAYHPSDRWDNLSYTGKKDGVSAVKGVVVRCHYDHGDDPEPEDVLSAAVHLEPRRWEGEQFVFTKKLLAGTATSIPDAGEISGPLSGPLMAGIVSGAWFSSREKAAPLWFRIPEHSVSDNLNEVVRKALCYFRMSTLTCVPLVERGEAFSVSYPISDGFKVDLEEGEVLATTASGRIIVTPTMAVHHVPHPDTGARALTEHIQGHNSYESLVNSDRFAAVVGYMCLRDMALRLYTGNKDVS